MELPENSTAGFSGGFSLFEAKKFRVERALLRLLNEWQSLDEHVDSSTQQSLEACLTDIQSRSERLNSVQESVTESSRVLDEVRMDLEERSEEIDRRDKEVREFYEEKRTELEGRENRLNFVKKFVQKSLKELDLREKEIEEKRKAVEELFEEFNLEKSEIEKIRGVVDGRFEEMKLKEREIEELNEKLNLERSELGKVEGFVFKRFMEMDLRKKSLTNREIEASARMWNVLQKEKEVEVKEMELVSIRNLNERKRKEVESMEQSIMLKDKQLDRVRKATQVLSKNVGSQKERFDREKKLVDEKAVDLAVKEKMFDDRLKEFELREQQLNEWVKTIELKKKDVDSLRSANEECVNAIVLKEKEIESKRILNEERSKELDSKEKCLHDMLTELKLKEQQFGSNVDSFEAKVKEVNSIRVSCEERCRSVELEKKALEGKLKELELKKKQLSNVDYSIVKTEPRSNDSSYANIRFSVTMDGKNLLLYLIDHKRDLDSMADEVYKALGLSKDPAKLVLDAMEDFYIRKEDKDFEVDVLCRSTILLLEQLRRISPPIQPRMQESALELAREWKVKMNNSQEVIVFLQLLASYKLGSAFEPREFLSVFEIIGQQIQVSELCQLLGYTDKIDDLVQVLLNKQQHILAVRFVCAFGLRDKYKPASLLKDFWKNAKEASETLRNNLNMSVIAKDEAIDNIVASLREAAACISNHKIESEFSHQCFETFIALLTKQKEDHMVVLPASVNDAQKQEAENNCKSGTNVPYPTQLDQEANGPVLDPKKAMAVVLSHMDGKSLQLFLNENSEDRELIFNDVSSALKLSRESVKLVLDAIEGFHPPHLEMGDKQYKSPVIMRSCILLLEQLTRLSPEIKPQVKEEALKVAFDWKENMRTPLQILGFFNLIVAYGLDSSFDPSELARLFQSVSKLKHEPELCRMFRLSEKRPDQSRTCNRHNKRSVGHDVNKKVKEKVSFIQSANQAKLVLDAMRGCYSNLNGFKKMSLVKSSIVLLQNLLRMSPQIHPRVKEDAASFAFDWIKRLENNRVRNPVEVSGVLHLLAFYKLASIVDSSELLDLFDCICEQRIALDLVRLLGLEHKIPDFIESLVRKGNRLQAIRYIYEFKLVDKFPPVPILKDLLNYTKELAAEIRRKETDHTAIVRAIREPLNALRGAVKCIKDYKLEVECPLKDCFAQIQQLKKLDKSTEKAEPPKKFRMKQNAAVPDENIQRAESCQNGRYRKRQNMAAGPDESQMQWHMRKHPRMQPLVETPLNVQYPVAYPAFQPRTQPLVETPLNVQYPVAYPAFQPRTNITSCEETYMQNRMMIPYRPYVVYPYNPYL